MKPPEKETLHRIPPVATKPLRVLCAEDNEQLAVMLKFALERAGFFVEWVDDGQRALDRITADVAFFDLIITDHRMPHLSGLQLVEGVRSTAYHGKIAVHSSHLLDAELTAYLALAVDHVFTKPVQLAEFLRVIRQLVASAP